MSTVYRQIVCLQTALSHCTLFLYCYESQFITKIQKDPSKQVLVDMFNNTFRYLNDGLALDNPDLKKLSIENFVKAITLNKSYISNDRTPFLDLD